MKKVEVHEKKPNLSQLRKAGWLVCLLLIVVLGIMGWQPMQDAALQALGVKALLETSEGMSRKQLFNPFMCLRGTFSQEQSKEALVRVSDLYLQGVATCMMGKDKEGMDFLMDAGNEGGAKVQYAAAVSLDDANRAIELMQEAGLDQEELVAVLVDLSGRVDIDPQPALIELARQANKESETWALWLKEWEKLIEKNDWQEALDWMNEGLHFVPEEFASSIYLWRGRIYQLFAQPVDYTNALADYNQALQGDAWMYPADEATAHLFRGEVYRELTEEFTIQQTINEFETALEITPGSYWALLDLGDLYLYRLKEIDEAERYFQQAMESDEQSPYAYYFLGEVYKERGEKRAAIKWYHEALEKQPDLMSALERIMELEEK